MKTPTKDDVLAAIVASPITRDDLARLVVGGVNVRADRARILPLIEALRADGLIRKAQIHGRVHLVAADWVMPDHDKLAHIMGKCVPTDGGCMEFRGHYRGSMPWV